MDGNIDYRACCPVNKLCRSESREARANVKLIGKLGGKISKVNYCKGDFDRNFESGMSYTYWHQV